jgi:hypothetical protein
LLTFPILPLSNTTLDPVPPPFNLLILTELSSNLTPDIVLSVITLLLTFPILPLFNTTFSIILVETNPDNLVKAIVLSVITLLLTLPNVLLSNITFVPVPLLLFILDNVIELSSIYEIFFHKLLLFLYSIIPLLSLNP